MSRSLTRNSMEKYPAKYFVETGSYTGGGIQVAIYMGYEIIFSIESDEIFYNACKRNFKKNQNITLILGNSGEELGKVLENIHEKAVVFLDAHSMEYNPILEELNALKENRFKEHIIMIDDKREFKRGVWPEITVDLLLEKLLEINPNYTITYEDSVNANGDIIVAWIK